jgi:hypothetical protein
MAAMPQLLKAAPDGVEMLARRADFAFGELSERVRGVYLRLGGKHRGRCTLCALGAMFAPYKRANPQNLGDGGARYVLCPHLKRCCAMDPGCGPAGPTRGPSTRAGQQPDPRQSLRNAIMGSTLLARRAGT